MNKPWLILLAGSALPVATLACGESTPTATATPSRSFRLGLQPLPHALTAKATEQAHAYVSRHADLLFYH